MARRNGIWGTAGAAGLLLCVGTAQAIANPPAGDIGSPGDPYFIPEGFFAPGVPAVGTVAQQAAMAQGIEDMWALGTLMVDDLALFGQQQVHEVDALIASGATPFEVYEAATLRETRVYDREQENVDTVVDGIDAYFGPLQDEGAPVELLTAAFGPTLSSIGSVRAEGSHWVGQLASMRPATRPTPPPAPAPVASAPPPSTPRVSSAQQSGVMATPEPAPASVVTPPAPQVPQAQQAAAPSQPVMTQRERRQLERAERKAERARIKAEKRAERQRVKAEKQAERARKKAERAEQRRLKKLERQRAKEAKRLERERRKAERKR